MSRVGRAGRLRDLAAALCLVAGAALWLWAAAQVRALSLADVQPPPGRTHVQELDRRMAPLTTLSRAGIALVVVGVGLGVWSFLRHRSSTASVR